MNDIVNRIAEGRAELLGVEEICKRLGVSRSTFDRWRGVVNLARPSYDTETSVQLPKNITLRVREKTGESDGMTRFPPPDIKLGNSPKWEISTFKKWLSENVKP